MKHTPAKSGHKKRKTVRVTKKPARVRKPVRK